MRQILIIYLIRALILCRGSTLFCSTLKQVKQFENASSLITDQILGQFYRRDSEPLISMFPCIGHNLYAGEKVLFQLELIPCCLC